MSRIVTVFALILLTAPALAEGWDIRTDDPWCQRDDGHRYCEVRETTIPALPSD